MCSDLWGKEARNNSAILRAWDGLWQFRTMTVKTFDPKQAMLNRRVEELQATVARQQKQIDALSAGLQKVSAQLKASKAAPQVVNNP
jgi:hypothetical protein